MIRCLNKFNKNFKLFINSQIYHKLNTKLKTIIDYHMRGIIKTFFIN
jgi:hypothetical protein